MPDNPAAIDLKSVPQLQEAVEAVRRTGKPLAIQSDGEDVAVIVPIGPKRRQRVPRGKPITAEDPIWKIEGMGHSGKSDVSANVDKYLAEAKLSKMR